jgi:SAM-dependent methyltransferase
LTLGHDAEALKTAVEAASVELEANSSAFLRRVFADGLAKYVQRLRQYGFEGHGDVLDAGCGFGQWSLALSELNRHVEAIDIAPDRVQFLTELALALGKTNLAVCQCSLSRLGFEDRSFDAVFCYGVIFLTRWRESLTEFARVMRPGGRLYVNANGLGWYKNLWYAAPNKTADYDPEYRAAQVWLNTWRYRNGQPVQDGFDILIEPHELESALSELGFENISCAGEGLLGRAPGAAGPPPFFAATYFGDTGVYEIIAQRSR